MFGFKENREIKENNIFIFYAISDLLLPKQNINAIKYLGPNQSVWILIKLVFFCIPESSVVKNLQFKI